ncbi:MAG: hypothetical protein ACREQ5_23500, partial [Candidatus Dormibacteria bacterium]
AAPPAFEHHEDLSRLEIPAVVATVIVGDLGRGGLPGAPRQCPRRCRPCSPSRRPALPETA